MFVFKLFFVVAVICMAFLSDGEVSLTIRGFVFSFHLWEALLAVSVVVSIYKILFYFFKKLSKLFQFKPNLIKGLDYLQEAFSGMLMKDHELVFKALSKAKKNLGDIPIISWLEGQLYLINGDSYNARSKFFYLSAKERSTALGAYSLAQLSLQNKSDEEAVEAIKAILKIYPNAQGFLNKIIGLSLKIGKTKDAFEYLKRLESSRRKDVEAVVYYEKWKSSSQIDDLKKAYKLAPHISHIALDYSNELCKDNSRKSAQKVLRKSFEKSPSVAVFNKFISFSAESASEKIKKAEKLRKSSPQSWIPYYYLAKLSEEEGIFTIALNYIKQAYDLKKYDFIANEFEKINSLINSEERLENLTEAKKVEFFWHCSECGNRDLSWKSVCPHCLSVASYSYTEEIQEILPDIYKE